MKSARSRFNFLLVLSFFVLMLSGCGAGLLEEEIISPVKKVNSQTVNIVLVDRSPNQTEKDLIGCGEKIIYKPISNQNAEDPLTSVYEELFSLPGEVTYMGKTLFNPLGKEKSAQQPDIPLRFESAEIVNATAKIYMSGSIKAYACGVAPLRAQIEETAKQFSQVKKVELYLNNEIFDWSTENEI